MTSHTTFGSFNGRSAYFYSTVGIYKQNAVELYGVALFGLLAEIVDIKELVLFSFELLSLNFYNNVHWFIYDDCVDPSGEASTNCRTCLSCARCRKFCGAKIVNFIHRQSLR